ncbi:MAG TPA: PadR family transcriptional regulator [Terriglobia bacterium]|nr:PadR family transcriptional regulator [Terriglobia bacterium]
MSEILPGTLYLMILKTLEKGPMHGYGIARRIKHLSDEILEVEEGSLYPALQRMLIKGWIAAEWRPSENNRRARYYRLTAAGRRQLRVELSEFDRVVHAVRQIIQTA